MNLQHLAIIPDGNRRWGRRHGKKMSANFYLDSGFLGRDLAIHAFNRGVQNLTIWIGSMANLTKRPNVEIKALNLAYQKFFNDLQNDKFAVENHIKIDVFGRWREILEPKTVAAIEKTLATTADFTDAKRHLTVLIAYDGDDERGAALQKILSIVSNLYNSDDQHRKTDFFEKELSVSTSGDPKISADTLRQHSWTGHLPDVDLIIRTGVGDDPHNSAGFLSLLADNTQYAFLDTLWPDFTTAELDAMIDHFELRERRLGK
jgi:undecaprenyl diphosphate synthase